MTKKIIFLVLNILLLIFSIISLIFHADSAIPFYLRIILLIAIIAVFLLYYLFVILRLSRLNKLMYMVYLLLCVLTIGYILLNNLGIIDTLSSVQGLKNYILSTREKGVFVYMLIQALQIIILPIPAAIICIVGSLIYGPLLGGIYCSIGVLLGSYISFFIGRTFGYRVVAWIVGKSNTDKYSEILRKRGGFFLLLAFILPMFPDDILCLIAGITKMNIKTFFWITLITRPIGVICMSFFGSGYIIPFSGWGIYAWAGILVVAIAIMLLVFKYQEQMQNYILSKVFKSKKSN